MSCASYDAISDLSDIESYSWIKSQDLGLRKELGDLDIGMKEVFLIFGKDD